MPEQGGKENSMKNWFAVQVNATDDDWSTGSFDFDEAVKMAKVCGYEQIAEIAGDFDDDGNPTADPICVKVYRAGEDF